MSILDDWELVKARLYKQPTVEFWEYSKEADAISKYNLTLYQPKPRPNRVTRSMTKIAEGFAMMHGFASNEEERMWD